MNRRGMTLVEMLVAMTATLLLMAAVAQAFSVFGNAITGSRSVLEVDASMRTAAWRLRADLSGATASPVPPLGPDAGAGYFEVIEGPATDIAAGAGNAIGPADHDDVLMFTTQSTNPPFIGMAPTGLLESTLAEVAWFARPTPGTSNPVTYTLHRRQLLVMGYVGTAPFYASPGANNAMSWADAGGTWAAYFNMPCDVSVRREGNAVLPNTLADLTRREARFLHNPGGIVDGSMFPYAFVNHQTGTAPDGLVFEAASPRRGEDIVLTNVLAFDVRVFDPGAPITIPGSTALVPGDPGFTGTAVATGGYVDLGHGQAFNSLPFTGGGAPRFATTGQDVGGSGTDLPSTYDTWTLAYEANGRNENGNWVDRNGNGTRDPDEDLNDDAFDGLDNDGNGIIDDPAEFETRPPYPYPLRGIEVRIRCYEPESRQVRQVTIRHSFVPH